ANTAWATADQSDDSPILQYSELIPRAPDPNRLNMPNFTLSKLLLTINSVRSISLESDGKSVTIELNDADKQRFAELTRQSEGKLLFCQASAKPLVGGIGLISAPTESGIIEF